MNVRLLALTGVVVCAVALPLAVASAGQVGGSAEQAGGSAEQADGEERDAVRPSVRPSSVRPSAHDDHKEPGAADPARLLGLGLATAARCGPELTSPDGVEAQTCVLTQGEQTWARTYYRNVTGGALEAVLSLMGPGGRTVQMHCAVGSEDEPGSCETPRERTRRDVDGYTAVAEFAAAPGQGPLLLRAGSNSGVPTGS
ncbi:hypothetical protein SLINC_4182 [Streptomyces lincolnensis]|uniref:Uncharacterized protein n=1 Tax=Streptomyces lincolnensis TaxID=1915 RepID=A0A1B1MCP6_STRLN|nr:hypothetical protein [Streptomyces lincolnensis]ANS66406.1 hypothetical protein SLINC_4182 [Streptomyces lincolnensis]AXG55277.1 hypothetical protein SLCG_4122 [Streptomyces lincolnensis]QMV08208.1 hypothetical protein GJU35_22850 [Streptomyces lincolnensis]